MSTEEQRAKQRAWYRAHRDRLLENARVYYAENKDERELYRKRPEVAEAHRQESAKRRRQSPEVVNASNKRYAAKLRAQFIEAYGSRCACCGENRPEFLQLDHSNHDGALHRATFSGQVLFDLRRRGWPQEGYRLLCANCNFATKRPGMVCPHERGRVESNAGP